MVQGSGKNNPTENEVFGIALRALPTDVALPFNIYLLLAQTYTLFRRVGDTISAERLIGLNRHGVRQVYGLKEDRTAYKEFLWEQVAGTAGPERLHALQSAAFAESQDLHESTDLGATVSEVFKRFSKASEFAPASVTLISPLISQAFTNSYAQQHGVNTAIYSMSLAKMIPNSSYVHPSSGSEIGFGALLHDLGEKKLPPSILVDNDILCREAFTELKKHPALGVECVKSAPEVTEIMRSAIYDHHENFDGSGYPRGITGEAISEAARIISICDVFDTLTVPRNPQTALPPKQAVAIMQAMQPGRFDPGYFAIFTSCFG